MTSTDTTPAGGRSPSRTRYIYLASFAHQNGFGNEEVVATGGPLSSVTHIRQVEEGIAADYRLRGVVILAWTLLRTEQVAGGAA